MKEKNSAKTTVKKQEKVVTKSTSSDGAGSLFFKVIYNAVGGLVAAFICMILFQHNEPDTSQNPPKLPYNSGYDWMLNQMLSGNLKTIEEHPDLTIQQKYEAKWGGGEITYINQIVSQTKANDILLFPPKDVLQKVGFKGSLDKPWLAYFIYPRKFSYDSDSIKLNYNKIVAINGWGVDKSADVVTNPQPVMILNAKK